jgi:steroid 5-alpha reductase family enzyme
MRAHYGLRFRWISLFTVFLLQGALLWFVSLPLQLAAAQNSEQPFRALDALGVTVFLIGFAFEAVGDWQLSRFKGDAANAGRVLDRGLWRYTRHPNYFGDFLVWWGLFLLAAACGAWWTIAGPLMMSVLLLRVSGVSLLERSLNQRKPEYAEYVRRTSSFFPWPPRHQPS